MAAFFIVKEESTPVRHSKDSQEQPFAYRSCLSLSRVNTEGHTKHIMWCEDTSHVGLRHPIDSYDRGLGVSDAAHLSNTACLSV